MTSKNTKKIAFLLGAISITGVTVTTVATPGFATTSNVIANNTNLKVTVTSKIAINVRTGPSTNYSVVGKTVSPDSFTATFNNNWLKVTSGKYAGKYVSYGSASWFNVTVINPPVITPPTTIPPGYNSGTSLTGTGQASINYTGQTVTRYIGTYDWTTKIRNTPAFDIKNANDNVYTAHVGPGTKVSGTYTKDGLWFNVTSGTYKNKWISSGILTDYVKQKDVNGNLNPADLLPLSINNINTAYNKYQVRYLSKSAATAFAQMDAAYYAQFKKHLIVNEGYRPLALQEKYYKIYGYPRAAIPGTSNHGLGNAVDFGTVGSTINSAGPSSPLYYGNSLDVWLTQNGWKFGFDRPDYMDKTGYNPEYWHYNFTG